MRTTLKLRIADATASILELDLRLSRLSKLIDHSAVARLRKSLSVALLLLNQIPHAADNARRNANRVDEILNDVDVQMSAFKLQHQSK